MMGFRIVRELVAAIAWIALIASATAAAAAEPPAPKRILLLGQKPDGHPPTTHEYFAGHKILKKCLDRVEGLEAAIVDAGEPFRDGPEIIDAADGVVIFLAEGARWIHQDPARLAALDRLAERSGAIVGLHWGIGCKDAQYIERFVKLVGGCHGGPDRKFAVGRTTTEVADLRHPIMTGVEAVTVEEEFYYRLKFIKPESSIVPLLRVPMEGDSHTVAWAWERPDKGRSFGFSGCHFHRNWEHESYRRMVAQGIVWSLKLPVPVAGLNVEVTEDDLKLPDM